MFVDRVQIELLAGKGGDGCSSLRREKFVPRGGPDGGDGGDGASIIIEARLGVNSLAAFANRRMYRAPKGRPGQGSLRHGRNGREQRLFVPPGTTVIDAEHGVGYNARTGDFANLIDAGVMDPVKVTYTALLNALSIAELILTTQTLIADIPEDDDPTAGRARGGGAEEYGMR